MSAYMLGPISSFINVIFIATNFTIMFLNNIIILILLLKYWLSFLLLVVVVFVLL